jgi:hypothetical protein
MACPAEQDATIRLVNVAEWEPMPRRIHARMSGGMTATTSASVAKKVAGCSSSCLLPAGVEGSVHWFENVLSRSLRFVATDTMIRCCHT